MPIDIKNDDLETALSKLKAREDTLRSLENVAGLGSWEIDLATKESIWSPKSYEIYKVPQDSEVGLDFFTNTLLLPQYRDKIDEIIQKVIRSKEAHHITCKAKRTDGKIIDISINVQAIFDEKGKATKLIGTTQDLTEYLQLKQHTKELVELIEYSSNEIYILDIDTLDYLYANKGARDALGYTKQELLSMNVKEINPDLTQERIEEIASTMKSKGYALNRAIHKRKDGTRYPVQSYIHTLTYQNRDAIVLFDTDISQTLQLEQELHHQAHHDLLTGLPNRMLFHDRLSQAIVSAKRHETKFALLFLDLDHFKTINDSLGHQIGDKVLIEATKRLKSILREEDTLSRLGGDEFTIILKDIHDIKDIVTVAKKINHILKEPIYIESQQLYISASIGISIYPDNTHTEENLIKYADTAMYKAKEDGRDRFAFYSTEMTEDAYRNVVLENSLRIAIKEQQFEIYYQPQYDAKNERIVGMEALVRWQHPHLGIIPPNEFIPMAEKVGLIVEIDKIVMQKAMQQFATWYRDGLKPGTLALNLAMKHLNEQEFIPYLLNTMQQYNFHPSWLEMELTEGDIMRDPETSIKKLNILHEIGIELAIDDFGTGYSSLSYLKKFPLTKLKIDRSFIKDIPTDEEDIAITKAIIALSKSLRLKLIAEGVETEEQRLFVRDNGCNYIQGYYYSKPIPAQEVTTLLS